MNKESESRIIIRTTIKIMVMNAFLAIMKIVVGIFGKSTALISDAVNSVSDILTNLVVMISGKFSHKGSDKDHPYGHEKYDSMVSVLLGFAILVTAFEIGKGAVNVLYNYFKYGTEITPPHFVALIAALLTVGMKEYMYHFTKSSALKAHSSSLRAQAMDHRSDELASFGAFVGIGGSILGYHFLEPIASLIICFFVAKVGFEIIKDGVSQVVDQSVDDTTIKEIENVIYSFQEVLRIDDLRTRQFGMKMYIDLEIELNRELTLWAAHEIAERVHDKIEQEIPNVLHCMIHVNPSK